LNRYFLVLTLSAVALAPAGAAPTLLEQATALLNQGEFDRAGALAQTALSQNPENADALVVAGTALLYSKAAPRRDDSIYRPTVDAAAAGDLTVPLPAALEVAALWKRVPALDASRAYLWGDIAQMVFRAGGSAAALEYAQAALDSPNADPDSLKAAASVFALNLDWTKAAQTLGRIPGNRTALLYQGLEAWRLGKDGWRVPLQAFAQNPGTDTAGVKLAAYLSGPDMRDGENGYQAALQVEPGLPSLAVRQKYVERYPDKFLARLDLARTLSVYGSFDKALAQFAEIDRKALAGSADERQTILFQQAWAYQGSGRTAEADKVWQMLTESRDFYIRSAAAWFLGMDAIARGKAAEAKTLWTWQPPSPPRKPAANSAPTPPELLPSIIQEAGRSKYAAWAAQEYRKLP